MKIVRSVVLFAAFTVVSDYSFSQQWDIRYVDPKGDAHTEIQTEIQNDEIHYLCKGGLGQMFYYYSSDRGKTWRMSKARLIDHHSLDVGELASVIDKNGIYHMIYFDPNGNIIQESKQDSDNWVMDTVYTNISHDNDPWHRIFLESDSQNRLHVLYGNYDNLKYFIKEAGEWYQWPIDYSSVKYLEESAFCLDANDNPHIVISTIGNSLYHVYGDNRGEWKTEQMGGVRVQNCIEMRADNKGGLHVVFAQDKNYFDESNLREYATYFRKRPGGAWEKIVLEKVIITEKNTHAFCCNEPSLDVDEYGGVHIGYIPYPQVDMEDLPGDTLVYTYFGEDGELVSSYGVPCAKILFSGLELNAEGDSIYYAYVGSPDGKTSDSGLMLAVAAIPGIKQAVDSLPVIANRETEIQAEVEVINTSVTLYFWDNGEIDNDILSIRLNDELILDGYVLQREQKELVLNLEHGKTYYLSAFAVSEGEFPPCTAVVKVLDGTSETIITLVSDSSKNGTIKLLVK